MKLATWEVGSGMGEVESGKWKCKEGSGNCKMYLRYHEAKRAKSEEWDVGDEKWNVGSRKLKV